MIARVKIAPIEQWCKELTDRMMYFPTLHFENLVGLEIEIDTASMKMESYYHDSPVRAWRVLPESVQKMDEVSGYFDRPPEHKYLACEHMLEMD